MPPRRAGGCGPTTDLNTLFDGAGKVAAGTMDEEELKYYEDTACPTCGTCSGMFTANSHQLPVPRRSASPCPATAPYPCRLQPSASRLAKRDGHEAVMDAGGRTASAPPTS